MFSFISGFVAGDGNLREKAVDEALKRKDALVREAVELLRRADEILGSLIGA